MVHHGKPPLALRLVFLGKHIAMLIDRRLATSGLNRTQTAILMALRHHPGLQPLRLGSPAGVEAANVTRTLQSLERLGLVERRPHPTDGRASLFYLTTDGEERARFLSEVVEALSAEMLQGLDAEDLPVLEKALASLLRGMSHQHPAFGSHHRGARGPSPAEALEEMSMDNNDDSTADQHKEKPRTDS